MLRIGHRGAAGHEPENTLASVRRAIGLGVDLVEVDLQRTRDGELVILHDKRVDRTTNGAGYVREMSLAEVRALDAGRGERIPTARELLDACRGRVEVMLEIIDPAAAAQAMRLLAETASLETSIVASFHHACLLELRRLDPNVRTLALIEGVPVEETAFARAAGVTHVGISLDSITASFVHALQREGLAVFVYTANDPRDIATLSAMCVDGIVSDFPERVPHA